MKKRNDIRGGGKLDGSEIEEKAEKQPKKKTKKKRFTKTNLGRKGKKRKCANKKGICFQFVIKNLINLNNTCLI